MSKYKLSVYRKEERRDIERKKGEQE